MHTAFTRLYARATRGERAFGSATITTGSSTETFMFSNFSVKLDAFNTGTKAKPVVTATITINGSVTSTTDETQTFSNVVYNSSDLN